MNLERKVRPGGGIFALNALILALGLFSPAAAPAGDNRGTDFWICFPEGMFIPYVTVVAETATDISVEIPWLGQTDFISIGAGESIDTRIPPEVMIQAIDVVESKGVHIRASSPVSVYGYSEYSLAFQNGGSYLALPINRLGSEYFVLTFSGTYTGFTVLATQDDTTVTIVLKADCGEKLARVPYEVNLDSGQTYYLANLQSGTSYDLTGSHIESDKPVAVFGGKIGYIPDDILCCGDVIVEQIPALFDLGMDHMVVPFAERTCGDIVRVLATHDQTEIAVNGVQAAVINRSEYYEFTIHEPVDIVSSCAVLVGQFMQSYTVDGVSGDPEFLLVSPTHKFLNGYLIRAGDSPWDNYLNLVVPSGAVSSLVMDGIPVNPSGFAAIGSSGYSAKQLEVCAGVHSIYCSSPFGAIVYGMDEMGSYAHSGGLALTGIPLTCFDPPPVPLPPPYSGSVRVFPNPFNRATAVNGSVKFEGAPIGASVRIYTSRGLRAWEGEVRRPYILEWSGHNEEGIRVAPGVYIWVVEFENKKERGTLIVE